MTKILAITLLATLLGAYGLNFFQSSAVVNPAQSVSTPLFDGGNPGGYNP